VRFESKPVTGSFVRFDGSNADALAAFAGEDFQGVRGDEAWVRTESGDLVPVRPGGVVSRTDGQDGVTVSSPQAWDRWMREAA
jgi:hypothetical protein